MDDVQVDEEEQKEERYLRWADRCGWVLVAGLVIEFVYVLCSGKPGDVPPAVETFQAALPALSR